MAATAWYYVGDKRPCENPFKAKFAESTFHAPSGIGPASF